jgi:rhizosphere induced protein
MLNELGLSRRNLLLLGGATGVAGLAHLTQAEARASGATSESGGTTYTIRFVNNSTNNWDFCCYQQDPGLTKNPGVMSLAWFAQPVAPTTTTKYSWQVLYNFVWAQTGILVPGVIFDASQTRDANPDGTNNQIGLTKTSRGSYTFTPQTSAQAGSLFVNCDNTIAANELSVGVGMSGNGTFVVPAQPNINVTFTPHPEYWVTFGDLESGQVMDIQSVVSTSAKVSFPPNVYSMTATLKADNTWSVVPTNSPEANAMFRANKSSRKR